jgi:hypothetical protein
MDLVRDLLLVEATFSLQKVIIASQGDFPAQGEGTLLEEDA